MTNQWGSNKKEPPLREGRFCMNFLSELGSKSQFEVGVG